MGERKQLEDLGAAAASTLKARQISFPAGPTHQTQVNALIPSLSISNLQSWTNTFTRYVFTFSVLFKPYDPANELFGGGVIIATSPATIDLRQAKHRRLGCLILLKRLELQTLPLL